MNANDLIADIELEPSWTGEERTTLLRALRLLAAAEANDGSTPETDRLVDSTLPVQKWVMARDLCCRLERERNGLAARVGELERDAERYRWLVNADHWSYTPPPMRAVRASWLCSLAKAELDAAIDAARSKP